MLIVQSRVAFEDVNLVHMYENELKQFKLKKFNFMILYKKKRDQCSKYIKQKKLKYNKIQTMLHKKWLTYIDYNRIHALILN